MFVAKGSEVSGPIPIVSDVDHALTEDLPAGWILASASCTGATGSNGTLAGSTISGIHAAAGDHITCTFTNTNVPPTVDVTKTATPGTVVTPGAPVVFDVLVANTSDEQVRVTALTDSVYGNLNDPANPNITANTCAVLPVLLAAQGAAAGADEFACSFSADITGVAGDTHTNTITGTVVDADGTDAMDTGSATVNVLAGAATAAALRRRLRRPAAATPPPPPPRRRADLEVEKSVDPGTIEVGETAEFTLTVTNHGPDAANNVTVTDVVPDGLDIVDVEGPPGACQTSGQTVTCALGTLANQATGTITITVEGTEVGTFDNVAAVDSSTPDPNDENNTDDGTVVVEDPGPGPCVPLDDDGPMRVEGVTRVETAIAVSQVLFCDGEADGVVLTRSDLFPDAQAGTPLAILKDAAMLLSEPASLNPATEVEIQRVLPAGGTVYMLGGTAALSQAVEDRIVELGYTAVRYGGANRFGTAAIIADEGLGNPDTLLAANGGRFADSVVAGAASLAAGGGTELAAVILTSDENIPPETAAYLASRSDDPTTFAIGGAAAMAFPDVEGIFGATRFETAVMVAERFFEAPRIVGLATGLNFADALTGGTLIGRWRSGRGRCCSPIPTSCPTRSVRT